MAWIARILIVAVCWGAGAGRGPAAVEAPLVPVETPGERERTRSTQNIVKQGHPDIHEVSVQP